MAEESHKIKIYGSNTRITGSQPALILTEDLKEEDTPLSKTPKNKKESRLTSLEKTINNNAKESNFKVKNHQAFTLVSLIFLLLIQIGLGFYSYLSIESLEEDVLDLEVELHQLREDMNISQDDIESRLIPLE